MKKSSNFSNHEFKQQLSDVALGKDLIQTVERWRVGLMCIVIALVFFYFYWFGIRNSLPLSKTADVWGQFGDFLGGIINPLVAYAAFYWLTMSVIMQKVELNETKEALKAAADAQAEQAKYARQTLRLSALSSLFNFASNEIESARNELRDISAQTEKWPDRPVVLLNGRVLNQTELEGMRSELIFKIGHYRDHRVNYEKEINSLLSDSRE